MKIFRILFLAILAYVLSFAANVAIGQSQRTYTAAERQIWQARIAGTHNPAGAWAGAGAGGDYAIVRSFANDFRADPYRAGNTNAANLAISTGYATSSEIGYVPKYPQWQGIKAECAAWVYLLTSDTSYGQPFRRMLLKQITMPGYSAPATFPVNAYSEAGTQESIWLIRLARGYDYTSLLFSAGERQAIETWLRSQGYWYFNRAHTALAAAFPRRLQNDYTIRLGAASPEGFKYWSDPIWLRDQNYWSNDSYLYTHRNQDGTLGNKVAGIHGAYHNRESERTLAVGVIGIVTQDTMLVRHAIQFDKEVVMFGSWPDGTINDYIRNGDYDIPGQGAEGYCAYIREGYITLADMLAKRGNYELYTFSTRDGVHGTQCQIGQPAKSLATLIERSIKNMTGEAPRIFYNKVAESSRISNFSTLPAQLRLGVPYQFGWDYSIALANRWYRSTRMAQAYRRQLSGQIQYATNMASAKQIWYSWGGSGATVPSVPLMYGATEGLIYARDATTNTGTPAPIDNGPVIAFSDTTIVAGRTSYKLNARVTAVSGVATVGWRQISGTPVSFSPQRLDVCILSAQRPLDPVPVGRVYVQIGASDKNGKEVRKTVRIDLVP